MHILGNIFVECLPQLGRNEAQQMANLNARIKAWYKENRVSSRLQGNLSKADLRSNGWPKLKGKGAAVRHLAPFGAKLAAEFNSGSLHDRRRCAVVDDLVRFYEIVNDGDRVLSGEAKAELATLGQRLCGIYACLSDEALQNDAKLWHFVPKFHLFFHLCTHQSQDFGNPRFYWCYADEDMVGHMVEVAKSCHPATLAATALYKYLVIMFD